MRLRHLFFESFLLLVSITNLVALPDPDLFDGRVLPSSALSIGSAEDEEKEVELAKEDRVEHSGSLSESHDYSQFDGVDHGQKVAGGDSKNSENVERITFKDASIESVSQATRAREPKSNASEAAIETQRSFEDFEIGSYGGAATAVEVNRSKELTEESSAKSNSTLSAESTTQQHSDASKTGIQEQTKKSSGADFGSDLPAGL